MTSNTEGPLKYEELLLLLPCHSLEDFPTHHLGQDAQGLLAAWTAIWHPALIASAGSAPTWLPADDPPDDLQNRLIVVPGVSAHDLPGDFAARGAEAGAVVICDQLERDQIVQQALEKAGDSVAHVDPDIVADFFSLAYCYLQIELLTRQMRYSTILDEATFFEQVVEAARAAAAGDVESTYEKLQSCFDLLAEERDHYYSVDVYIVDLTLIAPTTLGTSLRQEFESPTPLNVLLSGSVLAEMAKREPESLARLRDAIEQARCGLVGGERDEQCLPLLSRETLLAELHAARRLYQQHLSNTPAVFGRWRFGLTSALPQILNKVGFDGAIHATLEDGRNPKGSQIKTRWEGNDQAAIDALAKPPLDASDPAAFLKLAASLGDSMDIDHVATVFFAHWPGTACQWLHDVKRSARFGEVMGRFVTLDDYFRDTDYPGHLDRFKADQYRSPYLKQSIIRQHADPISSVVGYWRRQAKAEALAVVNMMVGAAAGQRRTLDPELVDRVNRSLEAVPDDDLDQQLDDALTAAAADFAAGLSRPDSEAGEGYLLVNPLSVDRRTDVAAARQPAGLREPEVAAPAGDGSLPSITETPALGYAWVGTGAAGEPGERVKSKRGRATALAEDRRPKVETLVLQNERFQAILNTSTGTLASIRDYKTRGPRLSQQLAMRLPPTAAGARQAENGDDLSHLYSVMVADEVVITQNSQSIGEVTSRGQLRDHAGQLLADFRQTYRLRRGDQVLQLQIELDTHVEPRADPWRSYYACRFAWADEGAELFRDVHQARTATDAKQFEAPNYIEIDNGQIRNTILTGGLPYHQRVGYRMLDSLLVVHGETSRRFSLGIGIDLVRPMLAAVDFITPQLIVPGVAQPQAGTTGWLFHLDAKNIIVTHAECLVEQGSVCGVRLRLLETMGRSTKVTLSSFRPLVSGRQTDFTEQTITQCEVDADCLRLQLAGHEWTQIEARWSL